MNLSKAAQMTHVLLRIVAGLLFFHHGAQKLLAWFGGVGEGGGTVPLMSMMGAAGVLELFGGLAIMLGLFTRSIAFLLAGEMAVAYFMVHQPNGAWPIQNRGEAAVLFCFIFLFLAAHGAGGMSLDSVIRRRAPRVAS